MQRTYKETALRWSTPIKYYCFYWDESWNQVLPRAQGKQLPTFETSFIFIIKLCLQNASSSCPQTCWKFPQYPKECHPPLSFTLLPETSPKVLILSLGKPGIPTGHHNLLRTQVVREWPLSSLLHPKGWKTWTSVFIPYHEVNQSKKGHSPLAYGWERMFVPQVGTSQDPRNGRS